MPDPELALISTDPTGTRGLQQPQPTGRLRCRCTRTNSAGPNVSVSNTSWARIRRSDTVSVAFVLAYPVLVQIMGSVLHIAVNSCNVSTRMQPSLNIWHPEGSAAHGPKGVWLVRYGHCDGWAGSAHEAAQCSALSLPPPAA